MGRTANKLSVLAFAVAIVAGLMAVAFGLGYFIGKILL
jgi:hypothetical protein